MSDAPSSIEAALNGVTSRKRERARADHARGARQGRARVRRRGRDGHPHARADSWSAPAKRPRTVRGGVPPGRRRSIRASSVTRPTGVGPTIEDRYRHVELLDDMGLMRAAFVDTGSVNLGGTGPDGLPAGRELRVQEHFADDRATR